MLTMNTAHGWSLLCRTASERLRCRWQREVQETQHQERRNRGRRGGYASGEIWKFSGRGCGGGMKVNGSDGGWCSYLDSRAFLQHVSLLMPFIRESMVISVQSLRAPSCRTSSTTSSSVVSKPSSTSLSPYHPVRQCRLWVHRPRQTASSDPTTSNDRRPIRRTFRALWGLIGLGGHENAPGTYPPGVC